MLDLKNSSDRRKLSTFRTHLVLTCITVTGIFAVVIALSVFVPLAAHLGRVEVGEEVSAGLAEHFLFIHAALWPLIFLSLIACIFSGVVLYERMRSPLVRFVRYFDQIGSGVLPDPLVIRLGDYLTEEADSLNAMLHELREESTRRAQAATKIEAILEELSRREVDPILIADLSTAVKSGLYSMSPSAHDDL